jgi:hypothetical protein
MSDGVWKYGCQVRQNGRYYVKTMVKVVVALIGIGAVSSAWAWDGVVSGATVTAIDVTDGTNLGFRIYLPATACGNAYNWAYLNTADSNYAVYVSVLLLAKTMGSTVTVYSNRDASGYCHIGYLGAS